MSSIHPSIHPPPSLLLHCLFILFILSLSIFSISLQTVCQNPVQFVHLKKIAICLFHLSFLHFFRNCFESVHLSFITFQFHQLFLFSCRITFIVISVSLWFLSVFHIYYEVWTTGSQKLWWQLNVIFVLLSLYFLSYKHKTRGV